MKKITLLLTAIIFSVNGFGQVPNWLWAKEIGSTSTYFKTAVDGSGNVYNMGWFTGTRDFDPSPGVFNLSSGGSQDMFISKLDANGNFVWARSMEGTGLIWSRAIAI